MASQRMNYKAKYNNDIMCPLCKKEEDTTEHVLTCEEMPEHKYMESALPLRHRGCCKVGKNNLTISNE